MGQTSHDVATVAGGVFVGVLANGECVVRGFGDVGGDAAEAVAVHLILLASKLRNARRASQAAAITRRH